MFNITDYVEVINDLTLDELKLELSEIVLHEISLDRKLTRIATDELFNLKDSSDTKDKIINKLGRIFAEKHFTSEKKARILNRIAVVSQKLYDENQRKSFNKE